ncbi:MAG: citC [Herbinix sp.]|jgi:[citrate (pro-3S)-lyase] ligase|nr:citC [Herbinix sp.]
MLRFCDSEVYIKYEETITRSELFTFFCSEGQNASIIVVLNNEDIFQGIITYDSLLHSSSGNGFIQRESVVLNDEVWVNAKRLFDNNKKIIYLPIFNIQNELIYFCYNGSGNLEETHIDHILDRMEQNQEYLFIQELYPRVQVVCIHDFNEWAYRFYNVLKARGIPVVTIGVKWKDFGILEAEDLFQYPDYSVMNIYAEGTELVFEERDRTRKDRFRPCMGFDFLLTIAQMNTLYVENLIKQEVRGKFFRCSIPWFSQLKDYSLSEFHRFKTYFHLDNASPMVPEHFKDEHSMEICGLKYQEVLGKLQQEKDKVKNHLNIIELDHTSIIGKRYGIGKYTICLIGPCIIAGVGTLEQDQLAYSLLSLVEGLYPNKFSIVTLPILPYYFRERELALKQLVKNKYNLIISIDQIVSKLPESLSRVVNVDLNLLDLFNARPLDEAWFADVPIHTNGIGNRAIAKEIFTKLLEPSLQSMDFSEDESNTLIEPIQMTRKEVQELNSYLNMIRKDCFDVEIHDRVGAIVMNCNPFTKGHLYLIEEARKQVDYLYIFVVEEDRSFFSFADRIELVRKGVSSFDNVKVLPSGSFILSYNTLPSYFSKDTVQNITIDATIDIQLFAEFIAPALKVTVRFVGEEPLDNITNQYNREMERSLEEYGINFIEIKRKTSEEEVISASKVRRLLNNNSFDEIKKIVPECTYDYLTDRYADKLI